eukprot:10570957-Ditylum_brightwellii.AAC.1
MHGYCAAVSKRGQIYVMGGYDRSSNLLHVKVFSPTSGQWTSLPPMQPKCLGCTAVSMGMQIYVMGEVVTVEDTAVTQSAAATSTSLTQYSRNATTQEVCQWLARHGISKASLDILQCKDIDGIFLFEEPIDEIRSVLKEESMSAGCSGKLRGKWFIHHV